MGTGLFSSPHLENRPVPIYWAESSLEGSEKRLELTPALDAFAKDGLTHLLRACRAHIPLRAVELKTCGLELETDEVENAPHVSFEIRHDVLVLHPEDLARQHRIPVRHELDVLTVVARDVLDAVGEFLAVREQLLEIAEAARHRFAPGVDDLRIRQDEVDQADVPEIVRHLVDEMRFAGAVDPGVRQVFLTVIA